MSGLSTESRRPPPVWRLLQRAPLPLYRLGLGALLGPRLRLTHVGRRTGLHRHTILEVIAHDAQRDEYFVAAFWGPGCDWYRNIQAAPAVEVVVGRRRFTPQQRFVAGDEAEALIARYRARRPRWSRFAERTIRRPVTAAATPIVGFRSVDGRHGREGP